MEYKDIEKRIQALEFENRELKRTLHDTQIFLVDTVARMAVEEYKRANHTQQSALKNG